MVRKDVIRMQGVDGRDAPEEGSLAFLLVLCLIALAAKVLVCLGQVEPRLAHLCPRSRCTISTVSPGHLLLLLFRSIVLAVGCLLQVFVWLLK